VPLEDILDEIEKEKKQKEEYDPESWKSCVFPIIAILFVAFAIAFPFIILYLLGFWSI